jgi:hypothetical protein
VDLEAWLLAIFAALGVACIGVIIWAIASGNADCPKGQQAGIVTYMPMTIGNTVTVQPIYGCVSNG